MLVHPGTMVHHQPNVPMLVNPDLLLEQLKCIQRTSSKYVELPIVPERGNRRLYYRMIDHRTRNCSDAGPPNKIFQNTNGRT